MWWLNTRRLHGNYPWPTSTEWLIVSALLCSVPSWFGWLQFSGGEEKIKQAVGTFCSNQPFALEIIKTKQKKDSRFTSFIQVVNSTYIIQTQLIIMRCRGVFHWFSIYVINLFEELNWMHLVCHMQHSYLFRSLKCIQTILFFALQEAESNRLCRRLQLKDIIPVEMQRLTKYPLLLDNISKYTGAVLLPYQPFRVLYHSNYWFVHVEISLCTQGYFKVEITLYRFTAYTI